MSKAKVGLGLTGAVALGAIGVLGLRESGSAPFRLARVVFVQPESAPAWARRSALVDGALGRLDLSRAIYEWREAYGAAQRSGRSEGLIAVADRAVRIAEHADGRGYFLKEARSIYVHAALRARAEGSRDTILSIAERFEHRGDTERAEQVRRIARRQS
jgi:hypothetical protein